MKKWLDDFPKHPATVAVALLLILAMGVVVTVRLARGLDFPAGYETYIWSLVALCGVTGAWGVGNRLSDYNYAAIKAGQAPSPVTAQAGSTVTVAPEKPAPAAGGPTIP